MLPKANRLTDDHSFRLLKKHGIVTHTPLFVLSILSNKTQTVRVGFIASAKVGGAVQRNRAVRVLREAVRQMLPEINEGHDIVLIAKKQILSAKTAEVLPVLQKALDKAGLRKYARIQTSG